MTEFEEFQRRERAREEARRRVRSYVEAGGMEVRELVDIIQSVFACLDPDGVETAIVGVLRSEFSLPISLIIEMIGATLGYPEDDEALREVEAKVRPLLDTYRASRRQEVDPD